MRQTLVRLAYEAHARVGGDKALERLRGFIGGTVIDDDELEIDGLLPENAFYRRVEIGAAVVHAHYDRHQRPVGHLRSRSKAQARRPARHHPRSDAAAL